MRRWRLWTILGVFGWVTLFHGTRTHAAAEVKLGKDFLDGVVAKLPPTSFEKADKYRGTVHSYRLVSIDARARRFLIACQIEGEFHPPVTGPISERVGRSPQTPEGWRKFRFDVKARVNIEPGADGAPRFRIEIDEVKKRELDGFSGVVAKFLGQYFDELVTQLASGRASRLNKRLNDEIMKRVTAFKEYGVFRAIDYTPSEVVLHFDVTRFRSEGIAGYVFADEQPGTVPLYRWFHPRDGSHFYTIRPNAPDRPNSVIDGISCRVYDHPVADSVALYHWRSRRDDLYTISSDGENAGRAGYRPHDITCYIYRDIKPGTVPLYRFFDPVRGQHFYTLHPHAEFAK
jgi:Repeat of unknown function (DUF5648)